MELCDLHVDQTKSAEVYMVFGMQRSSAFTVLLQEPCPMSRPGP
jgi:hypothetical protein